MGDLSSTAVRMGNLLSSRFALLCIVALVYGCFWMVPHLQVVCSDFDPVYMRVYIHIYMHVYINIYPKLFTVSKIKIKFQDPQYIDITIYIWYYIYIYLYNLNADRAGASPGGTTRFQSPSWFSILCSPSPKLRASFFPAHLAWSFWPLVLQSNTTFWEYVGCQGATIDIYFHICVLLSWLSLSIITPCKAYCAGLRRVHV